MLEFSGRRFKLRIVFMGTSEFDVLPLEHLILNQFQVVAVYTQPDKPAGRGRILASPPLKRSALTWHLPVVQPLSLKRVEVVEQLAGFSSNIPSSLFFFSNKTFIFLIFQQLFVHNLAAYMYTKT